MEDQVRMRGHDRTQAYPWQQLQQTLGLFHLVPHHVRILPTLPRLVALLTWYTVPFWEQQHISFSELGLIAASTARKASTRYRMQISGAICLTLSRIGAAPSLVWSKDAAAVVDTVRFEFWKLPLLCTFFIHFFSVTRTVHSRVKYLVRLL